MATPRLRPTVGLLCSLAAACGNGGESPPLPVPPVARASICEPKGALAGYNGGIVDGVSLATVRAAQCEGVTYADPSSVDLADETRAVTVGPMGTASALDAVTPVLYGVLRSTGCSPSRAVNAYADEHAVAAAADGAAATEDLVGMPLVGVDVGPCTASCSEARGERCQDDRCRAYPIVWAGKPVVFSGANLWDAVSSSVVYSVPGLDLRTEYTAALNLVPEEQDLAGRCTASPVAQGADISAEQPGFEPTPAEARLDQIRSVAPVPAGTFYGVQTIAMNGSYFRAGDAVPAAANRTFHSGRVIHLCSLPQCDPSPDANDAACNLEDLATCSDDVGGVWHEPPRSLEQCDSLLDRESPDVLAREVVHRGDVDSRLTVNGMAVTAASFAVLPPVG